MSSARHSERFAPSPTGPLHLGHAFSALTGWQNAQVDGGTFLLRIEDIDRSRARPEWESQIFEDLKWLGLDWPQPVLRQSERLPAHQEALENLWKRRIIYPCTCRRRDIQAALSAPQEGVWTTGPDGPVYPGTCRHRHSRTGPLPEGDITLRLDMAAATSATGLLDFTETGQSPRGVTGDISFAPTNLVSSAGDIVLARRDLGTSYHLAVVVDDAYQQITHVTRGQDLFEATYIHVLLQHLLGLPVPVFHHHRLIRDEAGKRLAKRDDARAIAHYRAEGATPGDIRRMIGLETSAGHAKL
ncbi:tRNA glutamyl-Q(34) synthetase GluQRS [Algicella marina]|uniref:tRNA glutamyl-Q(34) synthetase GluQRS n=1 Tax=Algicella marina TaxID=2683284 RepID=A0A6P1SUZ5_9RHOB|nr:tRNA glutamyl-Q(34) synthetase GluQRS [Algicella marina]QHQ34514.1 tRNA glutamyl-Q(34) synthetase GluQRS [Algicella marina]